MEPEGPHTREGESRTHCKPTWGTQENRHLSQNAPSSEDPQKANRGKKKDRGTTFGKAGDGTYMNDPTGEKQSSKKKSSLRGLWGGGFGGGVGCWGGGGGFWGWPCFGGGGGGGGFGGWGGFGGGFWVRGGGGLFLFFGVGGGGGGWVGGGGLAGFYL